jgi:acetyltransferase
MSVTVQPRAEGCARAWRDKPYRETLVLGDGRRVNLRPLHYSDGAALYHFFFRRLSFHARLMRFHGAVNHLPGTALLAMTTQVPGRHVALGALAATDDGLPQLLAEARYIVQDDGEAEFAIAVADAWQGQGLGRALVQRLIAHARAHGVPVLHGAAVPGNERLLRLMDSLGAKFRAQGAEVSVRLSM